MEGLRVSEETGPVPEVAHKDSLLKKYDIPVGHLDFDYVEKCKNARELEKIYHILKSGEEGYYPQLLEFTEKHLSLLKPNSRHIRKVTPVVDKKMLNKEELNDLSEDLQGWLDDVNKTNKELESTKKRTPSGLPDVRQSKEFQEKKDNEKNIKRIKSTDYSSWDKYDPDTEILKMDLETEKLKKEIETKKKVENKRTVKFNEFQTKAEAEFESNKEKEKGNEYYKAGEYKMAYTHYTNSINFNPCCANYNNRAMTNIKLKKYEPAVKDCKAALKYEPDNIKALIRLAQSHEALQNYEEAISAAESAIRINPNNTLAQNLINKLSSKVDRPANSSTRLKIVEITENSQASQGSNNYVPKVTISTTNNKSKATPLNYNFSKKSILKSYPKPKREQVLLPIPGPSNMPEPYFVTVENKDPEIIKRQEYILNNRPQMIYLTNVDNVDENDCTEIHVKKSDSKYKHLWSGKENISENVKNIEANVKNGKIKVNKESLDIVEILIENKEDEADLNKNICNNTIEEDKIIEIDKEFKKIEINVMEDINKNEIETQDQDEAKYSGDKIENPTQNMNLKKKIDADENESVKVSQQNESLKKVDIKEIEENGIVIHTNNNNEDIENKILIEELPNDTSPNTKNENSNTEGGNLIQNEKRLVLDNEKQILNNPQEVDNNRNEEPVLDNNAELVENRNIINSRPDNGGGGEPHLHPTNPLDIQIEEIHMPYTFLRMWKSVGSDTTYTKHADILRNIDFNRINEVIGYKLDGTMLSDILQTLYLHFTVPHEIERVHSALENLATIPRFNICKMFLTANERCRVECLLQFLEQHGRPLSTNIKRLYF